MNSYQEAMDKIRDELANCAGRPGIDVLGEHLTARLQTQPDLAPLILTQGKTIEGAMGTIREAARKKQKNGVAVVSDNEAFTILEAYFGIPSNVPAKPQALAAHDAGPMAALDLDRLLGR